MKHFKEWNSNSASEHARKMVLVTLACSEQFHSLKSSNSPYRSIWGFWKWAVLIAHTQKHGFGHQKQVSSMLRSLVTPKLEFHFLKLSLASYSMYGLFLSFRSIWVLWKLSQMIAHAQKHGLGHQNHVSSMLRSWIRISLLEVLLELIQLLQPLHRICGLQVNLRCLKMISNDCLCPKTFIWTPEPSF